MVSVFSHRDRILLVDYLEKGATITDSYYTPLLDKVKQAMVSKQQESCQKECCFSRTMPPHTVPITQRKLADLHCEVLKHAASSSDLAHSE